MRLVTLQQTGFTASACHHAELWALTPLVSPLPLKGQYRFCGTFPEVALGCR